ncbi:MAG: hypothetical protein IKJ19_06315 [Clostridia bacterium]|nr:hypothetical protein [Clostridia bacterium]
MEFWQTLTLLQKIYFCIGSAASVFLILQIITLLFGIGDGASGDVDISTDADVDIDGDFEVGDGFALFSVRGIVSFFAIGGWTGYAISFASVGWSIAGSLIAGTLALFAMALIMKGVMKLRSSGNIDISKAVGKIATVYLTIPQKGAGSGKINLTLEERYVELNAITESDQKIPTGSHVKITAVNGDLLIVEKI